MYGSYVEICEIIVALQVLENKRNWAERTELNYDLRLTRSINDFAFLFLFTSQLKTGMFSNL